MGKRSTDSSGPSLGERVHIWLTSAKILYGLLIPLLAGMSAYGTSDTVRSTVQRYINPPTPPVAGGEVVSPVSEDGWRPQVQQSLTSIVNKIEKIEARISKIETLSERDDTELQSQIDALKAWHE